MNKAVRHRFTVDDYHRMAEAGVLDDVRVELIRGEIIEMSPAGSPHSGHVRRITQRLMEIVQRRAVMSCQNGVVIENHSEPEPDIALLKWRDDFYTERNPIPEDVLLLIEVSDSSLDKDRDLKLPLYAEAGIPECWIVDVTRKAVEVHRQPSGNTYEETFELQAGQELELVGVEGVRVELADILGQV